MIYKAKISGERLQDHWSSGIFFLQAKYLTKKTVAGSVDAIRSLDESLVQLAVSTTKHTPIGGKVQIGGKVSSVECRTHNRKEAGSNLTRGMVLNKTLHLHCPVLVNPGKRPDMTEKC